MPPVQRAFSGRGGGPGNRLGDQNRRNGFVLEPLTGDRVYKRVRCFDGGTCRPLSTPGTMNRLAVLLPLRRWPAPSIRPMTGRVERSGRRVRFTAAGPQRTRGVPHVQIRLVHAAPQRPWYPEADPALSSWNRMRRFAHAPAFDRRCILGGRVAREVRRRGGYGPSSRLCPIAPTISIPCRTCVRQDTREVCQCQDAAPSGLITVPRGS